MAKIHERESLVRAADRALRDAVEQCCRGLTEGERLRVIASALGSAASEVAKWMIREERHPDDPEYPGGFE